MKRFIWLAAAVVALSAAQAQATLWTFEVALNGASERPTPVVTNGFGSAVVNFDDVTGAIGIAGTFNNLTVSAIAGHLHAFQSNPFDPANPAAPGQTANVMLGMTVSAATSGSFSATGDLNTLVAPGEPGLTFEQKKAKLLGGLSYLNIHTEAFPGGEIRGQLLNPVPEPASVTLALIGVAGAAAMVWRRKRRHA